MTSKGVLILLLVYAVVLSGSLTWLDLRGLSEPDWIALITTALFSLLTFWWYWLDSTSRSYRRSIWLNVAVIAFAVIAIPWYLMRSRPRGERLKAAGKLLAFIVLMISAMFAGSWPVVWFGS